MLFLLAYFPGCHLLVRLSEPDEQAVEADRRPEASSLGSDPGAGPPLPELDNDENLPPTPGLENDLPPTPGLENGEAPTVEDEISRVSAFPAGAGLSALASQSPRLTAAQRWAIRSWLSGNTGINTNTAIAPGEGQTIYRTQLRFRQLHSSPGAVDREINVLVNPQVLAYGVRENLTVFANIPLVKRDGTVRPPSPPGVFVELNDVGVADMRFFAKYRFYESDEPGETTRWSVFGGLEVPTFDKNFSSESWDPFLGTVWTHQSLEWGFDLDWFWNFNTGDNFFRYDQMRYDTAYTYVLLTGQNLDDKFWQLNSIFELNGSYVTDGSHLLFAAPGFQLALQSMIIEASLQLPIVRELRNAVEPDYTFVIGTRITW